MESCLILEERITGDKSHGLDSKGNLHNKIEREAVQSKFLEWETILVPQFDRLIQLYKVTFTEDNTVF